VKLDIVGVVTLAMITALGGGILRDIVLGSLPPACARVAPSSSRGGIDPARATLHTM